MKPNAVLVNVDRGKCVDEAALVAALQEGRIRGTALDMFESEPLLPESPLWCMDNVLLSPHCVDRTREFQFDTLHFFVRNMARHQAGGQLLSVCDKKSGD